MADHNHPSDISNISEAERIAIEKGKQAMIVKVMVLGLTRNLGECLGFGLLPVILGLLDAATQLGKVMITQAEAAEGSHGVGGTMIMLRDKLQYVERQLESHRAQGELGMAADTASRN